jgi:hypothetical protein
MSLLNRSELINRLESYKFDLETFNFEKLSIVQLMYLVYNKYGPDKNLRGGILESPNVYERTFYNKRGLQHQMNDKQYKEFLLQLIDPQ